MTPELQRRQDLAAIIAGKIIGTAGWHPGQLLHEEALVTDALAVADEIIRRTEPILPDLTGTTPIS